jgi:hypothetical protein
MCSHSVAGLYTEGSITYLRVEIESDQTTKRKVIERSKTLARDGETLASLSVPAGRTTVEVWQRPCSGNCAHLDSETDHCSTTFTTAENATVVVTTTYRAGQGCQGENVEGATAE